MAAATPGRSSPFPSSIFVGLDISAYPIFMQIPYDVNRLHIRDIYGLQLRNFKWQRVISVLLFN